MDKCLARGYWTTVEHTFIKCSMSLTLCHPYALRFSIMIDSSWPRGPGHCRQAVSPQHPAPGLRVMVLRRVVAVVEIASTRVIGAVPVPFCGLQQKHLTTGRLC